ncbi:MAG: RNase P subunit p30 family protein [Nitrososphaerota archaeon]|nr:RNase P subunit p30 family protein [Nitrososphaerota archaeon]
MPRKYIDFWINIVEDIDLSEIMARIRELGFSSIAVSIIDESKLEEIERIGRDFEINVYRKIVLEPDDKSTLLRELRTCRGRYEVVSVICRNLEVALTAARDNRVDTLIIPPDKRFRIDRGVAAIIKNCIEIPFKWFLDKSVRRDFLRVTDEIVEHLARKVDLIISSSASKISELRTPYEMISLLHIFGFNKESALNSVSTTPLKIIESNLVKLSSSYICRGVVKLD